MTARPDYYHVFGHMNDWLRDDQLSFEQRLNKRCDELAKAAVDVWIARRLARVSPRFRQLLPFESVALMVNGMKITGDIADAVRFARGREEARNFLIKEKGWSSEQFDEVEWVALHNALSANRMDMCLGCQNSTLVFVERG